VFTRLVEPNRVSPARVSAHLAISGLTEEPDADSSRPLEGVAGGHKYKAVTARRAWRGRIGLSAGRVELESMTTGAKAALSFSAVHLGGADFYCAVRSFQDTREFEGAVERLFARFPTASLPALLEAASESFGGDHYGLEHVIAEGRERVGRRILEGLVERFSSHYSALYEDHGRAIELLGAAGFELPPELRAAAEITLGRRLWGEIQTAQESFEAASYARAYEISDQARARKLELDLSAPRLHFTSMILDAVAGAVEHPDAAHLGAAIAILEIAQRLGIEADLSRAQERLYLSASKLPGGPALEKLAGLLGFTGGAMSEQAG
jgi:hypothetical protein